MPTSKRMIECGFGPNEILELGRAFLHSSRTSIDAFLAHRPDLRDIGVAAIASVLVPLQWPNALFGFNNVGDGRANVGDGDWYQYLWNRMLDGAESASDVPRNKVRFITFNYDLSLEVFFLHGLCNNFDVSEDDAFSLLPPVHHVYGTLGKYEKGAGYRYGDVSAENIQRASNSIKTVPASRPDIDGTAADWLSGTQRLYFVGFSFDEMNCRRLGIADVLRSRHGLPTNIAAIASSWDMTDGEQALAHKYVGSNDGQLRFENCKAMRFIRNIAHELT